MDASSLGSWVQRHISHKISSARSVTTASSSVRFITRPRLEKPVIVVSFEGWNDAGEAATMATSFLCQLWQATPFAEIDPDEYFDFTEVRPEIVAGDNGDQAISWPSTVISVASVHPSPKGDIIFVRGHEPQLHWRRYCEAIIELAQMVQASEVITLGAYLAEITHDRPVPVSVAASDTTLAKRFGLAVSAYEGPTGIVGVLGLALSSVGIPTTCVWGSVPCYSLPVSPKAASALVDVVGRLLGVPIDRSPLEELAQDYERQMDNLVRDDENVAMYVLRIRELEEAVGGEISAEGLAEEVERYLKDKRAR